MRYTWIDEFLLSKSGVTKDLQKDWNWIRNQIGDKMFVAALLSVVVMVLFCKKKAA